MVAGQILKVLIVVTSHSNLGDTNKPTGYYLPEVAHPYEVLKDDYKVEIASINGGKAPLDPSSLKLDDPVIKGFWEGGGEKLLANTLKLSDLNPKDYDAVIYAGGHGTMWDFPDNEKVKSLTAQIYENNGIVAAVCHGPAALVNVKLSSGKYLVDGKKVAGFSNAEEDAAGLTKTMPFLLESKLKARGGEYSAAALWQEHVVSDQRLVTGQNPASATAVAKAVARSLKENRKSSEARK